MEAYVQAVRQNPLGTLVGPLAILCGALLILAYVERRKRSVRDIRALVIGAVVLTGTGIAIALLAESLHGSAFVRQWLGTVAFLVAGWSIYWRFNRRRKSASLR